MPEVLRYYRQWQRDPKTLHRIRLGLTVPQVATEGVFNLSSRMGTYARCSRRNNTLIFSFSNHGAPPFAYERSVTVTGTAMEGRFAWLPALDEIRLVYQNTLGVYERRSYSDGRLAWTGETQIRASAKHPDIVRAPRFDTLFRTVYLAGELLGFVQEGDGTVGPEFFLTDSSGVNLAVEDDVHRIAIDFNDTYWLHVRISGEASTSLWYSTDLATWEREAGAVTGITSGTHPGIAAGHDGSLLAWAYTSGTLSRTYRDAGDTAFSAVTQVKDDGGVDLSVADGSASFAQSWERPERWILAVVLTGSVLPSDLYSSDAGATVTLIEDH